MNDGEKIRARDDKLLKRERSWRRARVGANVLAVICLLLILYAIHNPDPAFSEEEEVHYFVAGLLFWLLVLDWLNLRIWHIDSIKYYRSQIKTD